MTPPAPAARRVASLRLAAQCLASGSFDDVAAAARAMLAFQAQDFPGACWSLGLRVSGATEASVHEALAQGVIVRSWPMRGTLHFTAAADLHWMLNLTSERIVRGAAARRANLGLDDATLDRARDVALRGLAGGLRRTREQMMELFEQNQISTHEQRGYHLLWHLAQTRTLCFGPLEGSEQTFVLLAEWVKKPRVLGREEALAEFATRYFTSHGPATLQDFSWWSSLPMKDARLGVAAAGKTLASLDLDGTRYLLSPALLDAPDPGPLTLALPGFDEFMLGYQDRSAALPAAFAPRIVPGNNGMFLSTIVVDGQIVGTWKRTQRARHIAIEAVPFAPLSKATQRAFTLAADRYGAFLGRKVEVSFSDPQ